MSESTEFIKSNRADVPVCGPIFLRISVVASLVVNVTVVTLVIFVVLKKDTDVPLLNPVAETGAVCFVCDYLGPRIESNDTLYSVGRVEKDTFCCLKEMDELSPTFQQMARAIYKGKEDAPVTSRVTSSWMKGTTGAHLYLDPAPRNGTTLPWYDRGRTGFAYISGVKYQNGHIHIPSKGRYHVYSHVTYRRQTNTNKDKVFLHQIVREHPKQPNLGEVTLLVNSNSYSAHEKYQTSFLSAILDMRKNDRVAVKVSDVLSVHKQSMRTFFGVRKL
ncbi:tumor necrosis factor ligand superfamily member 15-like [Haliotis rubra]|uniref:tumor necrosis factor ligand superfamily member 15-like n=1 Tax=Haliotis rubra TaxID=36100 RepID=UPI001EE55E3C|nr:tumor necrosis factor ligand superfamily member 15-like [Haliotis rubra]